MAKDSLLSPALRLRGVREEPVPKGASEDREFSWRAENGRMFYFRAYDQGADRYNIFVEEAKPGGSRWERPQAGIAVKDPLIERLARDPNGFFGALARHGIAEESVVMSGAGLGPFSRFFESLEAGMEAVESALAANVWYDHIDRDKQNDPEYREQLRRGEAADAEDYWEAQQTAEDRAMKGPELLRGLYNMFGPLSEQPKIRDRLLSFYNEPSEENWDDVSSVILNGASTCWQYWVKTDPDAPMSKPLDGSWPRIPGKGQFMEILDAARADTVEKRRERADRRKQEIDSEGP